jgi:cytochrome c oxidase cbb3-type subunit I/II
LSTLSKRLRKGSFQKEVPAEAPALANIGTTRKEGEGLHFGWKERLPLLY